MTFGLTAGQPSALEPVAGVIEKGPPRGGPQLGVAQVRAEHPPEMTAVHGSGLAGEIGQRQRHHGGGGGGHDLGQLLHGRRRGPGT